MSRRLANHPSPANATKSRNRLKSRKVFFVPMAGMVTSAGMKVPMNEPRVEMA